MNVNSRQHLAIRTWFACIVAALNLVNTAVNHPTLFAQRLSVGTAGVSNPRSAHLALLVKANRDSVVLRWAPSTAGAWLAGNQAGYVVERIGVKRDGSILQKAYERLTSVPLIPWSLDEWKARSAPTDTFAAVAAQALYGAAFIPHAPEQGPVNALRNAADELSNRYSFALFAADNDAVAAYGLALRFADRSVQAGEKYLYRVYLYRSDSTYMVDTAYALVQALPPSPSPVPSELTAEGMEGRIVLQWTETPAAIYSGYRISRSDDNGRTFQPVMRSPLVATDSDTIRGIIHYRFDDTSLVNYQKHRYRVWGITPFAENGPAAEIESWARDRTAPPAPKVGTPQQKGQHSLQLDWEADPPAPDLAGFVVARSKTSLGGFRRLSRKSLAATARTYTDAASTASEPYYIVGALDTAGNVRFSLPVYGMLIDSLAPAAPSGLRGRIDSSGVVHLHWHLGQEPDIVGYRVLRSNAASHEFSQCTPTPVKDTTFTDSVSVKTLTRSVYYQVVAVDSRYNHSLPSVPIELRRPDRVPPEPPVFHSVVATDSMLHLRWIASRSSDLRSQLLFRRKAGESTWDLLGTRGRADTSYVDRTVVRNTTYEYMLLAVDSAGQRSAAAMPLQGRVYDPRILPSVDSLRAAYSGKLRKSILVTWRYISNATADEYFILYRLIPGKGLTQYQSLEGSRRSFEDGNLPRNGIYEYRIRVMDRAGRESAMSAAATVRVE